MDTWPILTIIIAGVIVWATVALGYFVLWLVKESSK